MSGIAGLWHRDGRPADRDMAAMGATLSHRGNGAGSRAWCENDIALLCCGANTTPESLHERQPLGGASGAVIVFDGRLDNRAALVARLGASRPRTGTLPDAALVLLAYEAWGLPFAAALLGDFALGIYDVRQKILVLARDAIGVRPMYYHRGPRVVAFGSEIKALLAHPDIPAIPDHAGLAAALKVGTGAERPGLTCFAGITGLPPGHVAVFTPDRCSVLRYWDFDPTRRIEYRDVERYREEFRERLVIAVRRRIRTSGPAAVAVSGGLDSSSIYAQAAALCREADGPCPAIIGISYVTDDPEADERTYLDALDAVVRLPIHRLALEPLLGVRLGIESQVRYSESPSPEALWGVTRAVAGAVRARGGRVLLTGHWGDQMLFDPAYLIDLTRRLAFGAVSRHLREYHRWFDPGEAFSLRRYFMAGLVRSHLPRGLLRLARRVKRQVTRPARRETLLSGLVRLAADTPAGRLPEHFHSEHARSLYGTIRSADTVGSLEWNNKVAALDGIDIAFPMLDRDLLEFLMAAPGDRQNQDGVPRRLLREALPAVLPPAIAARKGKANLSRAANRSVARDFPWIAQVLSSQADVVRRGYVQDAELSGLLDRAGAELQGGGAGGAWDLLDLLGFEVWLRVFFDRAPVQPQASAGLGDSQRDPAAHHSSRESE